MKALPSINALYNEHKGKGLHVFIVYAQSHDRAETEKFLAARGIEVPCPHGDANFNGYRNGWSGLPYAFVIGPDGKVAWEGRKGYEAVISKELARIKYPGLGKLEVVKEAEKAATKFGTGDFAGAREDALKLKEKEADKEAVVADADWIIARVDAKAASLRKKADDTKAAKRYHETVAALTELSGKGFKGMEVAEAAATELKELKKDKEVSKELKAWDGLAKTLEENKKAKDNQSKKTALNNFAKKNEGTAAADEAIKLASELE